LKIRGALGLDPKAEYQTWQKRHISSQCAVWKIKIITHKKNDDILGLNQGLSVQDSEGEACLLHGDEEAGSHQTLKLAAFGQMS
jgi:hypothetical protein